MVLAFCVCHISLKIVYISFIHLGEIDRISVFFMAEPYSVETSSQKLAVLVFFVFSLELFFYFYSSKTFLVKVYTGVGRRGGWCV